MKKQLIYLAGALGFASILAMGGAAGMHIYNTMTAPLTPEQKAAKITEIRLEVEEESRKRYEAVQADPNALPLTVPLIGRLLRLVRITTMPTLSFFLRKFSESATSWPLMALTALRCSSKCKNELPR
ncbi:hypothetical protein P4M26_03750 [Pseudomonas aeruginosa]|nr:hypothetical protein [Pseudomonas aeruginosa]MDF5989276.1 hypothetical protein [Pseudomonas aeruginosa]